MNSPNSLHLLHGKLEERARLLFNASVLTQAELLIVDAVADRFGESDPDVLLALALAVRAPRCGHVGVDLRKVRDQVVAEQELVSSPERDDALPSFAWPDDPVAWEQRVLDSSMVQPSGAAFAEPRPFVAQQLSPQSTLLMTRRMGWEQQQLATAVLALSKDEPTPHVDDREIEAGIARFDEAGEFVVDDQGREAIRTAAKRRLTVVAGGPGTGKTFQIKRLLALLLLAHPPSCTRPLRIELAAPTGKAAVRISEAMSEGLDVVAKATTPEVGEALRNLRAKTLHKLLGMRPDGTSRHGRERPIAADVIVVDEVSMADLSLMRRLVESVPSGARLVLLGDRDQLASVEAGSVLADLVRDSLDGSDQGPLMGSVVRFDRSYRFERAPTVAMIADCLRRRDDQRVPEACKLMTGAEVLGRDSSAVTYHGAPKHGRPTKEQLDALVAPYLADQGFAGVLARLLRRHGAHAAAMRSSDVHASLLEALDHYRVLAVHRRGPLGVSGLERELSRRVREVLEEALRGRNPDARIPVRSGFWLGQPVLITQNAYDVGLMNGDIGLVLPTTSGLAAVFPTVREGVTTPRPVALARLPAHESALAMTVHKSQGSQFERVALVLSGRPSPIQTRELVYTAVTRSSRYFDLLGRADELDEALRQRVRRASGLAELIAEAEGGLGKVAPLTALVQCMACGNAPCASDCEGSVLLSYCD